jgi:hypothetical protein
MAAVESKNHWRGSGNPFPPAAVARFSDLRPEVPTIKTAAVREIDTLVDGYLRATRVQGGDDKDTSGEHLAYEGKVFVIEGDYGAGKTHLAIELLDHVQDSRDRGQFQPRVIYHVAPGGTFLVLYTDLMSRAITADEILGRVREFYADIVADALRERPFASALVRQLEDDDADPQLVVERYALQEGALRQELRHRLSTVTRDESFSRALMLLLQPELRTLVWDWFTGKPPSQVLTELGIEKPIRTDVQALEALGVIALLYGRKNRRFVLVIDEMEKLVLTWDRSSNASAQAFKQLLEIFRAAGALLVTCGLSDIFTVLPRDPARIDAIIRPSPLTADEVRWYVEETQERVFGARTLRPFTEDSIKYLVYLTGGVAREVIRFCYDAYDYAAETGHEITPGVVNTVARGRSSSGGAEMVRNDIGRLLSEQEWRADARWLLRDPPDEVADFWIPAGERRAGCAVLITDSVLEEEHAAALGERVSGIKAVSRRRAVIVVVSGYLPAKLRQPLADALDGDPLIVYNPRTFDTDFTLAVKAAMGRISPASARTPVPGQPDSELRELRTETDRVARQQITTVRLLQELAARTEDRLTALQRALESALVPGGQPRQGDLPAALEAMFRRAQHSVVAYGNVRELVNEAFEVAAQEPGARFSLTHRLREPDAFSAIGVAAFLHEVLLGFREGVRAWIGTLSRSRGTGEGPTGSERARLRGICRTYDSLYGVAPLFKLDPLPELTSLTGGEQEVLSRAGRSARREELRSAFDGLGDRVYEAAIEFAGSGAEPEA